MRTNEGDGRARSENGARGCLGLFGSPEGTPRKPPSEGHKVDVEAFGFLQTDFGAQAGVS